MAGAAAGQGVDEIMTAKEYLSKLDLINLKIKNKEQELMEAKRNRGITITGGNGDRVQTSLCGSYGKQTENQAVEIVSLETEVENQIAEYMQIKHKYIDLIHGLTNEAYIKVLHCRYVCGKKDFNQVASDMGYSYKRVINIHGSALLAFERCYEELLKPENKTDGKKGKIWESPGKLVEKF